MSSGGGGDSVEIGPQCYCEVPECEPSMIQCQGCKHWFHPSCLKSGPPSSLAGDIFYNLKCKNCSSSGEEVMSRMKLQWLQVVMLTLYNLFLSETGKCGYFRWKEHICSFIDRHWNTFFGPTRKKTNTWFGTVAGTLSSGCPQYFKSGASELKEHGWWSLAVNKPPTLETLTCARPIKRQKTEVKEPAFKVEGLRSRREKSSFAAAMELKAKRAMTMEAKDIRKRRSWGPDRDSSSADSFPPIGDQTSLDIVAIATKSTSLDSTAMSRTLSKDSLSASDESLALTDSQERKREIRGPDLTEQESQMSTSSAKSDLWFTERDLAVGANIPQMLFQDDEADENEIDFEVDPCTITPPDSPIQETKDDPLPHMEDILSSLSVPKEEVTFTPFLSTNHNHVLINNSQAAVVKVRQESQDTHITETPSIPTQSEAESDSSDDENDTASRSSQESEELTQHTRKQSKIDMETANSAPPVKCVPMSVYEEKQLLRKLRALSSTQCNPAINRLKRKLVIRQLKRERGLPLFDLDSFIRKLIGNQIDLGNELMDYDRSLNPHNLPASRCKQSDYRVLDRYQTSYFSSMSHEQQPVTFLNRLVGTEDDQLMSTRSPYTSRMLKPFIRRDYESRPLKIRLFQELLASTNRNDPDYVAPPIYPIDYCYVRPQHIPSVNAICREFFWPGIDCSECLQYPDFTCVVLYRKFVIGFAFLVPDVKYNEAYISFIFTHPEWRGAGIATFMLYHLIQTCMGKDITLHVSASNTAMLLYQKFGFKPEEFIVDFYDKYFHEDSRDCKHAFFLRLHR